VIRVTTVPASHSSGDLLSRVGAAVAKNTRQLLHVMCLSVKDWLASSCGTCYSDTARAFSIRCVLFSRFSPFVLEAFPRLSWRAGNVV